MARELIIVYDVIVVGVGSVGSATLYHLALEGTDVLGLEQFNIPTEKGSSFGTRIILRAGHHPSPDGLNKRAYRLWKDLQDETGRQLLHITGSLGISGEDGQQFEDELQACRNDDLAYEILSGTEVSERFRAYELPSEYKALFQPDGGFLDCEQCISAYVEAAHQQGAEIHGRERVIDWNSSPDGVRVRTNRCEYEAAALVLTTGAWTGTLPDSLSAHLIPELHLTARFQPRTPAHFAPENFPVFSMTAEEGFCYGTPIHRKPGFKFARGAPIERPIDPNEVDREPTVEDVLSVRTFAEQYFPNGVGPTMGLKTGFITWTSDQSHSTPILDTLPNAENVIVGAGFSGGGFSTAPVSGEILSQLARNTTPHYDIDRFSINRCI